MKVQTCMMPKHCIMMCSMETWQITSVPFLSVAPDFQVASATDQKHALLLVLKQEGRFILGNLYV